MRYIDPKLGDTRIKKKFVLFLVSINGLTAWLEYVYLKQQYDYDYGNHRDRTA